MAASRSLALAAAATAVVAVAGPALAADSTVPISVTGLGGTRQFAVEDISGAPLTAIDLGTGGAKPFRTHVIDSSFLPSGTGNYSVTATMSNLYLKTGASTYNYAVKVPSSDLRIGFGSNPLAGSGVSLLDLPTLSASGTMASCLNLSGTLKSVLGLSVLGAVLDPSNTALTTLCNTLGVAGGPVDATLNAAQQTLSPVISSVADLPSALSGATGGTFTNPSYAVGTVGDGDTSGKAGAPAATAVSLMTGTHGLSSNLISALGTALNNALTGLPLVSATDTGAKTTLAEVVAKLKGTGATALDTALANVLSTLSAADQTTVINSVLSTVTANAPVLADVKGITGSYYSFPVLNAAPTTPVPGTYDGTMTVTFTQS